MNQQKRADRGNKNNQTIAKTTVTIASVAFKSLSLSCMATAAPGIETTKFKKRSKVYAKGWSKVIIVKNSGSI